MRVLEHALGDPAVVALYPAKVLDVPGSDCLWWHGAVSGRGHGRFNVGTVPTDRSSGRDDGHDDQDDDPEHRHGRGGGVRDLCVIAHRLGYALVDGASALNSVPVLGRSIALPGAVTMAATTRWCAVRRLLIEWR
jgi:hypothetical protein